MFDVSRIFAKQPGRIAGLAVRSVLPPDLPAGRVAARRPPLS